MLASQEMEAEETFRHLEEVSKLQALIPVGDFSHPGMWPKCDPWYQKGSIQAERTSLMSFKGCPQWSFKDLVQEKVHNDWDKENLPIFKKRKKEDLGK
ncbi:hypothetical protein WISP_116748 [Willisornis vidua]|uniref:Uncharacterized protein n=1 Tax=Willisornis vidua TaxID=1566151 RepID=A0ABQ9CTS7_9PASS|nr:hypothetical protein WISP_116748 [Willisornis vidua]